ncbi:ABC transporter permease [Acholeplasma hippikon]|uniref:Sulfate transport system permease protein CysW n=1 Tax=Acholeplasma hippikon TaxID=264636 RepID=A0A449BJ09_9MOLU|nr:iron ABC transporter permease [Acholeplasma hippikon]VEU82446.1 Sulfate transport system permease protein CysW [Acholeplasma hippikon]
MNEAIKTDKRKIQKNKVKTFFQKPENVILVLFGVVLTIATIAPILTLLVDTFVIKPGSYAAYATGKSSGFTLVNWKDLFFGNSSKQNLWLPLWNSIVLAVMSCLVSIAFGGTFAYLVTRTNMKFKKYLSAIFIFPYIMPQWTLAVVWLNLFKSAAVTGGSNGLVASLFNVNMPAWFVQGMFPSILILALHYAPFAYILIGSIFRNMDSNLEEAAVILNTPKWKVFRKVTLPMIYPAILSTVLLVFGSAMGSYPVPHYLKLTTLSTKYVQLGVRRAGQTSILGVIMMLFGVAILMVNQRATKSRKSYTTVTGKSGQASEVNLGKIGRYAIASFFIIFTFFTSIYPIFSFALETFLPNPGDYSFLKSGDWSSLTLKWWTHRGTGEAGTYGQQGILYNTMIWNGFKGSLIVASVSALVAGTIGLLIGYAVAKRRKTKLASFVNNIAFLPYLLPSLAIGIAFFIFGSNLGIYDTYLLVIIAGTIKYIPFSARSSLNSMMQLSNEIEEAALIQGIPWRKRMTRIIIPIQKAAIISGFMLPFMTAIRELTLFMLLVNQSKLSTTLLSYFDEMGLYAFSSGINLVIIITILLFNFGVNKLTGASLDKGVGGGK